LNNEKKHIKSIFSVSFFSRSECEKRKTIWDDCVAEINKDPGLKENFDVQMLAVMNQMGQ
jgi:hypothetical protein